jgi:uncharacterized protein
MTDSNNNLGRRDFLKAAGAAGLCPLLAGCAMKVGGAAAAPTGSAAATKSGAAAAAAQVLPQIPKRKLGKTGVEIPILGNGGAPSSLDNYADVLARGLQWGITYWDTSVSYANGELTIGKIFTEKPELRSKIFLVTKNGDIHTPLPVVENVEKEFQSSLKRMNTDHVDLYIVVHGITATAQLTDDLRKWADEKKKKGLIKFVGFSTHSEMPQNLMAASKLPWIDALLFRCDFRNMKDPKMQDAIEACSKAGIGMIAIKTIGATLDVKSEEDRKLSGYFTDKGFDPYQAKVKAVLEDKRITAAAVGMKTVAIADLYAKAVTDKVQLGAADHAALQQYAQATCDSYCPGCSHHCGEVLPDLPRLSDVMRYLMYHNSYGARDYARSLFAMIPADARQRMLTADYRLAETRCPQHIPIGRMVAEAFRVLA